MWLQPVSLMVVDFINEENLQLLQMIIPLSLFHRCLVVYVFITERSQNAKAIFTFKLKKYSEEQISIEMASNSKQQH